MACLWAARRNPTNNLGQPKFKAQSSKFKIAARSLDVSCDVSCDAGASRNFFSRTSRRSEVLDQKFRVRRDYSLSVQRCYRCNAACLDLTSLLIFPSIYIYIRARGWNTLCQTTELPVRSHKGNEQTDVQETWEYQWIMSWTAVR